MFEHIDTNTSQRIGFITLKRAEKRNALNELMVTELIQALNGFENNSRVKVVVLKAEGKAFCAGADLAYLQNLQNFSYEENLADSNHLKSLFHKIYTFPKVIIAQIQGHAIAGGCGLATVCDFSFTVPEALFGYTEVKIGFIPAIVKVFLLRKIGEGRAKELLLSGDLISAEQAQAYGLINYIVPAEALEAQVQEFAEKLIKTNSAQSMAYTKKMIADIQSKGLEEALNYAAEMNAKARGSEDCKKGIAAFLNKEEISW